MNYKLSMIAILSVLLITSGCTQQVQTSQIAEKPSLKPLGEDMQEKMERHLISSGIVTSRGNATTTEPTGLSSMGGLTQY